MEAISALLSLCEGKPPVTDGLLSQRDISVGFYILFNKLFNKLVWEQYAR